MQMLAINDLMYEMVFDAPDYHQLEKVWDLIIEDDRYDPLLERIPGWEVYSEPLQSIINKMVDDEDEAVKEIESLSADQPGNVDIGVLHINLLRNLKRTLELEQLTKYWYERAGNHYYIRLMYAVLLTEQERYNELFELFGNQPGLDGLTKENLPFTALMVSEFCACYVLAWLSKDCIDEAEPYYQILIDLDNKAPIIQNALIAMMTKKKEAYLKKI